MTIKINEYELNNRNVLQDSKTLKAICNHVNGFAESDYKHIANGILKILKKENLIEDKTKICNICDKKITEKEFKNNDGYCHGCFDKMHNK